MWLSHGWSSIQILTRVKSINAEKACFQSSSENVASIQEYIYVDLDIYIHEKNLDQLITMRPYISNS